MAKKIYLADGSYYGITDEMQEKMAGMWSLNTSAELNEVCKANRAIPGSVCQSCYSRRTELRWHHCFLAYANNFRVLSTNRLTEADVPTLNLSIFRFQAHGDLINRMHYLNLVTFADKNPKTTFALWTKNLQVLHDGGLIKRKNIIYVYSSLMLNEPKAKLPKGFDKTFTVFNRAYVREHKVKVNCQQKCLDCQLCYERNDTVHVNELIKSNGHGK